MLYITFVQKLYTTIINHYKYTSLTMKRIKNYENICCKDVLQYVFDLNSLDLEVYKKLKEEKESRADELAKKLGKERSNVYRSLQKLTFCNLCTKKTKTIETGGYYHLYLFKNAKALFTSYPNIRTSKSFLSILTNPSNPTIGSILFIDNDCSLDVGFSCPLLLVYKNNVDLESKICANLSM